MTLKQKFFDIYTSYYKKSNELDKMVEVADDYAIEFAKWYHSANNNEYHLYPTKNIEEHLQIFKKEKGL
jgi:hypothetical protein